jgi:putative Mg2+ transporter-C (MgtC) family protein
MIGTLPTRPIGTRTLGLVALGAAAVAIATIQVAGMAENKDAMSRVVQGSSRTSWPGIMASVSSARA